MAGSVTYHLGGYLPDAPAQNRMNEYDTNAGTYTEWDTNGTETLSRPLTDAEIAALTRQKYQLHQQ